jgi:hypothetical protein
MSAMSDDSRRHLLDHMISLETNAEGLDESLRVFLPLPNHRLALRPDVVIVEGTRGAGKTALFRLVTEGGAKLRDFFADPMIPDARWVDAFSASAAHPQEMVLDQFVSSVDGATDAPLRTFWAVHLLDCLSRSGVKEAVLPEALLKVHRDRESELSAWVPVAERHVAQVIACLDRVDVALHSRKELVFASYDYLDRLGLLEQTSQLRDRLIRALLALWLSLSTRYRNLRSKIFLRPDLLEQAKKSFPDASKLRSKTVSLEWDVDSLYRLVARHLANRGPHPKKMTEWLRAAGVELREHPGGARFGLVPEPLREDGQKEFARHLAGVFMGSGSRKGFTYRWIPAHLKDADGRIVPRSFLRLLGFAAREAQLDKGKGEALVTPSHLVAALIETSKDRVSELQEEYKFVGRLENLRDSKMLMDPKEVIKLLGRPRSEQDDGFGSRGEAVFSELRRIGVLEIRADGRVDVPDIYRYGYGIKRNGGTKQPR